MSPELGINPKTVAKRRKRVTVLDLKTEPKGPQFPILFEDNETMVVGLRRDTLPPLDDGVCALQSSISPQR